MCNQGFWGDGGLGEPVTMHSGPHAGAEGSGVIIGAWGEGNLLRHS